MTTTKLIPITFVLLWATGFISARYAMPHAEPFGFLALRFAIAGGILTMFGLATQRPFPKQKKIMNAMFAGTLIHGAYLSCIFWAIRNGLPAGMYALIIGLQPILTTLLAGQFLGSTTGWRHWSGLGLGLVGVLMVLWPKLGIPTAGFNAATITASFAAVVFISAGTIWQKRVDTGLDLITGTAWQYAGAVLLTGALSLTYESQSFDNSAELWFAMAWAVGVLSIGAIGLLMVLIRDGAINSIAALFYLVPAVTAIMANILFGEQLHGIQLVGMALVAGAVWIATSQRFSRVRVST
jgi:drug/metabolite transporter (DMT)-like permease